MQKDKSSITIQKRIQRDKELLIEQLKKTPIIQLCCEKLSIGRASYYRWRAQDKQFAKLADEALLEGKTFLNDLAVSKLLSAIQNNNLTATMYWLRNNHPDFTTRVEITARGVNQEINLTDEQKKLLDKALEMVAITPTGTKVDE